MKDNMFRAIYDALTQRGEDGEDVARDMALAFADIVKGEALVPMAEFRRFINEEPPHYHRELTACDQALINLSRNASSERVYYDALVKLHKALKA